MDETNLLISILFLAIFVELITTHYKKITTTSWKNIVAILFAGALGIVIGLQYRIDLISFLFGSEIHLVGCIITGLLIGAGSGAVYDFWKKKQELKPTQTK